MTSNTNQNNNNEPNRDNHSPLFEMHSCLKRLSINNIDQDTDIIDVESGIISGEYKCFRKLLSEIVKAYRAQFGAIIYIGEKGLKEVISVNGGTGLDSYHSWISQQNNYIFLLKTIELFLNRPLAQILPLDIPGTSGMFLFKIHPFEDGNARYVLIVHDPVKITPCKLDSFYKDAGLLFEFVFYWISEVIIYRKDLDALARGIIQKTLKNNGNILSSNPTRYLEIDGLKLLSKCGEAFDRMLTLEEMLLWARAANPGLDKEKADYYGPLLKFIKNGFEYCSGCSAAEKWEGCSQIGRLSERYVRTLVEWCRWIDMKPGDIAQIRRPANRPASTRLSLKRWESQVIEIRDMLDNKLKESVGSSAPSRNLLPKGLMQFFFMKSLAPLGKDVSDFDPLKYWTSEAPSDGEVAKAFSSIAQVAHYLFSRLPSENKTIESLLWLVSEYCHKTLGIPSRIDLRAHLLQAARGEPALHALKNYYRDHFFHALEVCFLGHFLLEVEIAPGMPLWRLANQYLGLGGDKQRVLRLWYLAALVHDIGYGIDVLKSLDGLLGFFKNDESLKGLCDDLKLAVSKLSKELGKTPFQKYTVEDKPGEDHGIVGARHLQELLVNIAKSDTNVKAEDYEQAVRAIAWHNSRKHTVSFRQEPLAFLLILCDSIQEWNRPHLDFASAATHVLSRMIGKGISEEDITGPLDSVNMNVKRDGPTWRLDDNAAGKLKFTLGYKQEIQLNSGVFNLWLDASCNFQRLDFEGLPADFDIDIEYITPAFSSQSDDNSPSQFQRLRDAAYDTHMGFLDEWFPSQPISGSDIITNGAVSYRPEYLDDHQGTLAKEHLTLHLRKLTKKKRITQDIGEFRKRLVKWKHYNLDREFSGDYAMPEYPT